ncbi:MAG: UbiA family prenyltransferase [Theionarchaea archaeon]|nr:UbiA family prenyltransferase [Theionarchaea archaeon]
MIETVKGYTDLTRIHFWFVWPLLFCSGLMLAFKVYGSFTWGLTAKVALIGLLGFEAGFVLNDYVDRDTDKKDIENSLTRYWRPFKERPIPSGIVSPKRAIQTFFVFVAGASLLAITLPYPHNVYVLAAGGYCYAMEYFYQTKKKNQTFPVAQLLGRTDFVLFPVAGYLCYGHPDKYALLFFAFFYPLALAHLGVNDIADTINDQAKGLKTIPVLYGAKGTAYWVLGFTILHVSIAPFFLREVGNIALASLGITSVLLGIVNYSVLKEKSPQAGLRVLPLIHMTMLIYGISIIASYAFS